MNASKTTAATKPTTDRTAKAPTHVAFQVKNREGKKAIWTRIGSAWQHSDGQGFNIQLDANPIDGKITLRIPTEKNK
jgi:hypothetical protein